MPFKSLITFSAAAVEMGVHPATIADTVRILGIKPQPVSTNARAKGLTEADFERIRKFWNRAPERAIA